MGFGKVKIHALFLRLRSLLILSVALVICSCQSSNLNGNGAINALKTNSQAIPVGTLWTSHFNIFRSVARDNAVTQATQPAAVMDTSFGTAGKVVLQASTGQNGLNMSAITALAVQSDRKIIAVGQAYDDGDSDTVIARFNPDGTLDTSFVGPNQSDAGFFTLDTSSMLGNVGAYDVAYDVVIQEGALDSDRRIYVAGEATSVDQSGPQSVFTVLRFLTDGSLDLDYGETGLTVPDFGTRQSSLRKIALQADGKIVALGVSGIDGSSSSRRFAVVRLNTDGTQDDTFGVNNPPDGTSIFEIQLGATVDEHVVGGISLDGANQRIFVTGRVGGSLIVMRMNPDGSLDQTFGETHSINGLQGKGVTANIVAGSNPQIQSGRTVLQLGQGGIGQKFLVGGVIEDSLNQVTQGFITQYNDDGSFDQTFGQSGMSTTQFGLNQASVEQLFQGTNGNIIALALGIGSIPPSSPSDYVALGQFNSNGNVDTSFGGDGYVSFQLASLTNSLSQNFMAAIQSSIQYDGNIVVAGWFSNISASQTVSALGSTPAPGMLIGQLKLDAPITPNQTQAAQFALVRFQVDGLAPNTSLGPNSSGTSPSGTSPSGTSPSGTSPSGTPSSTPSSDPTATDPGTVIDDVDALKLALGIPDPDPATCPGPLKIPHPRVGGVMSINFIDANDPTVMIFSDQGRTFPDSQGKTPYDVVIYGSDLIYENYYYVVRNTLVRTDFPPFSLDVAKTFIKVHMFGRDKNAAFGSDCQLKGVIVNKTDGHDNSGNENTTFVGGDISVDEQNQIVEHMYGKGNEAIICGGVTPNVPLDLRLTKLEVEDPISLVPSIEFSDLPSDFAAYTYPSGDDNVYHFHLQRPPLIVMFSGAASACGGVDSFHYAGQNVNTVATVEVDNGQKQCVDIRADGANIGFGLNGTVWSPNPPLKDDAGKCLYGEVLPTPLSYCSASPSPSPSPSDTSSPSPSPSSTETPCSCGGPSPSPSPTCIPTSGPSPSPSDTSSPNPSPSDTSGPSDNSCPSDGSSDPSPSPSPSCTCKPACASPQWPDNSFVCSPLSTGNKGDFFRLRFIDNLGQLAIFQDTTGAVPSIFDKKLTYYEEPLLKDADNIHGKGSFSFNPVKIYKQIFYQGASEYDGDPSTSPLGDQAGQEKVNIDTEWTAGTSDPAQNSGSLNFSATVDLKNGGKLSFENLSWVNIAYAPGLKTGNMSFDNSPSDPGIWSQEWLENVGLNAPRDSMTLTCPGSGGSCSVGETSITCDKGDPLPPDQRCHSWQEPTVYVDPTMGMNGGYYCPPPLPGEIPQCWSETSTSVPFLANPTIMTSKICGCGPEPAELSGYPEYPGPCNSGEITAYLPYGPVNKQRVSAEFLNLISPRQPVSSYNPVFLNNLFIFEVTPTPYQVPLIVGKPDGCEDSRNEIDADTGPLSDPKSNGLLRVVGRMKVSKGADSPFYHTQAVWPRACNSDPANLHGPLGHYGSPTFYDRDGNEVAACDWSEKPLRERSVVVKAFSQTCDLEVTLPSPSCFIDTSQDQRMLLPSPSGDGIWIEPVDLPAGAVRR